jgi:hypothetical protein
LKVGQETTLSTQHKKWARESAEKRHSINLSNNRGRGTHFGTHLKGCKGESSILQPLSENRAPLVFQRGDPRLLEGDIPEYACEECDEIDVKNGYPIVERKKCKANCLYIVVRETSYNSNTFRIQRIATGAEILRQNKIPDESMCSWRGNTRQLNLEIPNQFPQIDLIRKD